jgi:hypothetical protein
MAKRIVSVKRPDGYQEVKTWDYGEATAPKSWDREPMDIAQAAGGIGGAGAPWVGGTSSPFYRPGFVDNPSAQPVAPTQGAVGGGPKPSAGIPQLPIIFNNTIPPSNKPPGTSPAGAGGVAGAGANWAGGASSPATAPLTGPVQPSTGAAGVDANWWNAFASATHRIGNEDVKGVTPIDFYLPQAQAQGGGEQQALNLALADKAWGEQFYATYKRAPTDDDWRWHWFAQRGGVPGQTPAVGAASSPTALQSWGLNPSGQSQPYASPGPVYR